MAAALMQDNVWMQKQRYEEAEAHYHAVQAGTAVAGQSSAAAQGSGSLSNEILQARQQIQSALNQPGNQGGSAASPQVQNRLDELEHENKDLRKTTTDLRALIRKLESRVSALEIGGGDAPSAAKSAPAAADDEEDDDDDDDDDDIDLFGDDEDDEDATEKLNEVRAKALEQYMAKKAKKPVLVAKSSVLLDCKPWDDETDMKEMERRVRTIEKDGLTWGAGRLVELAYGIKKLTIICVVEDDKVGIEDLKEEIEEFEDIVQSVDVAAFNKI